MGMGPPPHRRAKVRQDGVVQQRHVDRADQGPQQQHRKRHQHQFQSMCRPHRRRRTLRQHVNHAPQIPQQRHLGKRVQHGKDAGHGKHTAKQQHIIPQIRPQLARRRVRGNISRKRIDKIFEETKHEGFPQIRNMKGEGLCDRHMGSADLSSRSRDPIVHAELLVCDLFD